MNLEQRLDRYMHTYKHSLVKSTIDRKNTNLRDTNPNLYQPNDPILSTEPTEKDDSQPWQVKGDLRNEKALRRFKEEFLVLKENQDVFNQEFSLKEIETELLRLDQYHFHVNFNTYKGPQMGEMDMSQDRIKKKVKIDKTVLTRQSVLDPLEKISPADLDP
jgi:hypothetical protein